MTLSDVASPRRSFNSKAAPAPSPRVSDVAAFAARGRWALPFGILLLTCSCAARSARPEAHGRFADRAPSAEEVAAALGAREAAVASFRGQAHLVYEGPQGTTKSSQMIVVQSPDRVRIDVMSPFGPSYTVAAYGNRLRAYDRGEKVLYVGSTSPENLRKYTRVPVKLDVLAMLIRGLPPRTEGASAGRVTAGAASWVWDVDTAGSGNLRVELDREQLRPLRASLTGASVSEALSVDFEQYRDVDGVDVPHLVRARLGDGGVVELEYSRIWRAVQLTATAFQIDPPSGVRVVGMDLNEADAGTL
jgi:outer membrane lipoprotein-sorting protein